MKTRTRILSMLMVLFMIFGLLPTYIAADETTRKVHVIVENNTASLADSVKWSEGSTPWNGTLIDEWVDLLETDTAISVVTRTVTEKGYTINDNNGSYIDMIAGLGADGSAGWMGLLNDWFTSEGLGSYKVGGDDEHLLADGDEIRMLYSCTFGPDVGGYPNDTTKTLASLEITGAETDNQFSPSRKDYQLVIGDVDSAEVTLVPTAYNKNFQVRVYKGDYSVSDRGIKRGETITVAPGDKLTIVVGDPSWPSMNNGSFGGAENVPAGIYTFDVVKTATGPSVTFESCFEALDGVADVSNDADYPWYYDENEGALVSSNGGVDSTDAEITFTFKKPAKLTFKYKASSESRWDFLKITKNDSVLNEKSYGENSKSDFSGNMTSYKEYSIEANSEDVIILAYSKDSGGKYYSDCVWLKDFTVSIPKTLTYHSNDDKGETSSQGAFGELTIRENPFEHENLRFEGWATSADGEVVYKSGDKLTLTEDTDLYAVWTHLWYLTFPNMPNGAKLEVSKDGKTIAPISSGKWVLENGEYDFTASLFGYEKKTGKLTVNGSDLASDETLTAMTRYDLSFAITPSDADVKTEIRNSENEVVLPENGVYKLPDGDYTYTIRSSGYKKTTGSFTISGSDKTLEITLIETKVWDGETISEPVLDEETYSYLISNGAELAWFAKEVNSGNTEIMGTLTADIELGDTEETHAFTPIGSSANPFAGMFDGAFHKIKYLKVTGNEYIGLFGKNSGAISGVILENADVTGKTRVGGIVGENTADGVIDSCGVSGTVTTTNASYSSYDIYIGGIAGKNSGTISKSYNEANIKKGSTGSSAIGGIAGYNYGTVESCYNAGTLDNNNYVGGIVGSGSGTIKNSLNIGSVSGSSVSAVTTATSGTFDNNYYLSTCGASDKNATAATSDEIKSEIFVYFLGGDFNVGDDLNNGYPVLSWQGGTKPSVTEDEIATHRYHIELNKYAKYLKDTSSVTAVYGEDTTIFDVMNNRIFAKKLSEFSLLTKENVTYELVDIGTVSTGCALATDGTLTYYYIDPSSYGTNFGTIRKFKLKLSVSGVEGISTEVEMNQVNIPWDVAKVKEAMTPALDTITFDSVKGDNTDINAVDKDLVLPYKPDGYSWIMLDWKTDHENIVKLNPSSWGTGSATLSLPETDTEVTLTAILKFNKADPVITLEKPITFTVKNGADQRRAEMQAALDLYTLDKLTDIDTKAVIDPENVTNDIQLLTTRKLGIDGKYYKLEVIPSNEYASVDTYRLNVQRALPEAGDQNVELTVRITHKDSGDKVEKVIGTICVKSLDADEINAELALMDDVKANLFDAIKDENKRPDRVVKNLHAFHEIYRGEDGKLVYVYDVEDETGNGIKPDDFPEYDSMSWIGYRTIKSSNEAVITHENLLVTRGSESKDVTLTFWLSSKKFARYAAIYPEDERFQKLYKQEVTLDLTVLAEGEPEEEPLTWDKAYASVLEYLEKNVTPAPASMNGEWAVIALARSDVKNDAWYLNYLNALKAKLSGSGLNGASELSRAILALTSIGEDASDYEGNDLVAKLIENTDGKYPAEKLGNTSLAFTLIALDSKPYENSARDEIIGILLKNQLDSGAWNINDENPTANPDATAMVITALSGDYDKENVKSAVDKALDWLASKFDKANGSGTPETDSQILVALTSLGIDPETDERFEGLVNSLISYANTDGSFSREKNSTSANEMSTEQAAYALAAYSRFVNEKNKLYDMSDAERIFPSSKLTTIIKLIDELTVNDCSRATASKIKAISDLYDSLSVGEKSKVTNYSDFNAKSASFNELLAAHKSALTRKLNEAFESLDSGDYSTSFWNELEKAFKDGLYEIDSATCSEDADNAASKAITALNAKESRLIYVTFALIGDSLHGEGGHESTETWIPTTGYNLNPGSTVYDLFVRAISDHGMDSEGASNGYVSSIKAPSDRGGFWLGEFDNGSGSGWVYTVNGDYPDVTLTDYVLADGDSVVWSYIDNYKDIFPDEGGNDDDKPTEPDKPSDPSEPTKPSEPALPFTDIDGHWSYENIEKAYKLGLMNGISEKLFAPDLTLTRAMFVTILFRLDGGKSDAAIPFTDVAKDSWYTEAVAWAYENGIVNGTSETTFSPDEAISREQLAVMLFRYADYKKLGLDEKSDSGKFSDSEKISAWAKDSLDRALGNGIMNGRSDKTLDPSGKATRAECAAMVIRFIEKAGK